MRTVEDDAKHVRAHLLGDGPGAGNAQGVAVGRESFANCSATREVIGLHRLELLLGQFSVFAKGGVDGQPTSV